jgi:hypothetical protein
MARISWGTHFNVTSGLDKLFALGHRARVFGHCDCAGERRRFWYPGAKRIPAGHIVCGYCRGRGAVIDVLESATMTQVPGIQRNRMWPASRGCGFTRNSAACFHSARQALKISFPRAICPYQLSPNLWLGMAINAPFGLPMNIPDRRAGRDFGAPPTAPYNATPSIAASWVIDRCRRGVQIRTQRKS